MKTMKNYWYALLAIMFVFAGCKSDSEVDARDAFVGTYDYVTDGEMTFTTFVPGIDPKLPLQSEGTFKIEKLSKKDSVLISGAFGGKIEPFKAIVKGSQLEFVKKSYNAKGQTFEVLLTVNNTTASLAKDTLTWVADDVTCEGKFMLVDINGKGNVNMTAHKKQVK